MEKLEGVSLKDRMRGEPMEVEEILDIGIQVRMRWPLSCQGNHPSRYQAGQHLSHQERAGQDPRL